jgi:collagen type I alpha
MVTYYHFELASHDVVQAEWLPAETYLETGQRADFYQDGVVRMFPDFAPVDAVSRWEADGCAPLVIVGPDVEALRRLLLERATQMPMAALPAIARSDRTRKRSMAPCRR